MTAALTEISGQTKVLIDMKDSFIGPQVAAAITANGIPVSDVGFWTTIEAEVIEAQTHVPGATLFYQSTTGNPAGTLNLVSWASTASRSISTRSPWRRSSSRKVRDCRSSFGGPPTTTTSSPR